MKLKYFLSAFLLILLLSGSAQAATYYISASTGDNSNDGSSDFPWKTLTYAATTAASNDTVYIFAGTYDEALGGSFPSTWAVKNPT